MFINYWMDLSAAIIENEIILVKASSTTKHWFDRMPPKIKAIFPENKPVHPEDFSPIVGEAHHLRLTKWGIEGVLKAPRRFHRYSNYVLYNQNQVEPFWVVFHRLPLN